MLQAQEFPGEVESVTEARNRAVGALGRSSPAVDRIAAIVTELAANSIRHADGGFTLRLSSYAAEVIVEVRDKSPSPPKLMTPSPSAPTGRGLLIVRLMADRWGCRPEKDGKTVWAELDL